MEIAVRTLQLGPLQAAVRLTVPTALLGGLLARVVEVRPWAPWQLDRLAIRGAGPQSEVTLRLASERGDPDPPCRQAAITELVMDVLEHLATRRREVSPEDGDDERPADP